MSDDEEHGAGAPRRTISGRMGRENFPMHRIESEAARQLREVMRKHRPKVDLNIDYAAIERRVLASYCHDELLVELPSSTRSEDILEDLRKVMRESETHSLRGGVSAEEEFLRSYSFFSKRVSLSVKKMYFNPMPFYAAFPEAAWETLKAPTYMNKGRAVGKTTTSGVWGWFLSSADRNACRAATLPTTWLANLENNDEP